MTRRDQIQLSDEEMRDFMRSAKTMILVTQGRDGFPHPMPMWFAVDAQERIVMTTFRKSQKVFNIRREPRVSLLVESGVAYQELKSVVIQAHAEIVDDPDYTAETMALISVFRGDAEEGQQALIRGASGVQASKRVVIRFEPVRILSWDHAKLGGVY